MSLLEYNPVIDNYLGRKSRHRFRQKKHFSQYVQTEDISKNLLEDFLHSYDDNRHKQDFFLMILYQTMEKALDKALLDNQFELYFQPQICLKTNQIQGVETLIRWNHPEYGMISPNKFIPIAEETELIIPIGEWVLKESCLQIKNLVSRYQPLQLAVNLSPYQFRDVHLVRSIIRILKETQFPPECLTLEITESHLIDDYDRIIKMINQLKDFGISFALDDFGTGYASFTHLNEIPFDIVKLDKSFVTYSLHSREKKAIISGMINIAQSLGLEIHAEGIENISEFNFLRDKLVDFGQGYLFSPPLSFKQFKQYLLTQKSISLAS